MKLYIKQKVFALTEDFTVTDESGQIVYRVSGSFMRIPKKFEIYDTSNNLVCEIEKELFRMFSHFNIRTSTHDLVVKKNFSWFNHSISIVGSNWRLEGNILNRDFRIVSGSHPILSFSKAFFSFQDSYELNIANENDAVLCLAIVIVIDRLIAESSSANSSVHT
ncbi:MAG: hypothetical protein GX074_00270 [Erysipelothrix sp.]|nr:hypothetical protein [Erysipelothrix sp.]